MIQVHGGVGFGQIFGVVLVELGRLVRDLARRPALVAVFQPEQIQSDAAALELFVNIGIVRHLVDGLRGVDRKQPLRELLVRHALGQRPLQAAIRRPLQRGSHGVLGALTACGDLSLVEPQAVEPEDLTVIGHTGDLLADIYADSTTHIYIYRGAQRQRRDCSIPPEWMLNSSSRGAQSQAEYSLAVRSVRPELPFQQILVLIPLLSEVDPLPAVADLRQQAYFFMTLRTVFGFRSIFLSLSHFQTRL